MHIKLLMSQAIQFQNNSRYIFKCFKALGKAREELGLGAAKEEFGAGWLILIDFFMDTLPVKEDSSCPGVRCLEKDTFTGTRIG